MDKSHVQKQDFIFPIKDKWSRVPLNKENSQFVTAGYAPSMSSVGKYLVKISFLKMVNVLFPFLVRC